VIEPDDKLHERLREAVAKAGPGAGFAVLSEPGFAIDKEPEPGVGIRMRFGTGTEDGFTTTMYNPSPERPRGWPGEIPFLADLGGSLTLFERPGRGFSVQWFEVPDTKAALSDLLGQSVAEGWRVVETPPSPPLPPHLVRGQYLLFERGKLTRTVTCVVAKGLGMIQLVEQPAS
jgi:hypothetical protein